MKSEKRLAQRKPANKNGSMTPREFMKLPLRERQKLLRKQAEEMLPYYRRPDADWREIETHDIFEV